MFRLKFIFNIIIHIIHINIHEREAGLILVLEDSLQEGVATHSSILAWRMTWTFSSSMGRGTWQATDHEVAQSRTRLK